mgnify:CR=1 FL=1
MFDIALLGTAGREYDILDKPYFRTKKILVIGDINNVLLKRLRKIFYKFLGACREKINCRATAPVAFH